MKKALILFVFLGMALMLSPVSRADNEVTNEKQKLTDIKEELAKQKEILEATKKKEQEALTRLAAVRKDLTKATRELAQANRNIFSNESKIKTLAVEIVEGEEKLGAQNKTLKGRVIEAYKSGGQPYFDLLFR